MSCRRNLPWLAVLFVCACDAHMPAYDLAMWRAQRKLGTLCHGHHSKPILWALGENSYLVTTKKCTRGGTPKPGGVIVGSTTEAVTHLCNDQGCKLLIGVGDWTERVGVEQPDAEGLFPPEPSPATAPGTPAASGTANDGVEAEIQAEIGAQIDARAAAILACTNGASAVVQVELQPGRTTISLAGKQAGTPAEACVRAALAELKPSKERAAPLTIQHSVTAE